MTWLRPLTVDEQPVEASLDLHLQAEREVTFTISSRASTGNAEALLCCQGGAVLSESEPAQPPACDLLAIQQRCQQRVLTAQECYDLFRSWGIDYGPGLQGLKHLFLGNGEVLGELGFEAIEWLHRQLDDDASGTVDITESNEVCPQQHHSCYKSIGRRNLIMKVS